MSNATPINVRSFYGNQDTEKQTLYFPMFMHASHSITYVSMIEQANPSCESD